MLSGMDQAIISSAALHSSHGSALSIDDKPIKLPALNVASVDNFPLSLPSSLAFPLKIRVFCPE